MDRTQLLHTFERLKTKAQVAVFAGSWAVRWHQVSDGGVMAWAMLGWVGMWAWERRKRKKKMQTNSSGICTVAVSTSGSNLRPRPKAPEPTPEDIRAYNNMHCTGASDEGTGASDAPCLAPCNLTRASWRPNPTAGQVANASQVAFDFQQRRIQELRILRKLHPI